MSFIDAVAQMSKYAKFLKELLTNRKKMEEVKKVVLNENCSAAMLNKLLKRKGDLGSLTLPCQFGNLATIYAFADLGGKCKSHVVLILQEIRSSGAKANSNGNSPSK